MYFIHHRHWRFHWLARCPYRSGAWCYWWKQCSHPATSRLPSWQHMWRLVWRCWCCAWWGRSRKQELVSRGRNRGADEVGAGRPWERRGQGRGGGDGEEGVQRKKSFHDSTISIVRTTLISLYTARALRLINYLGGSLPTYMHVSGGVGLRVY